MRLRRVPGCLEQLLERLDPVAQENVRRPVHAQVLQQRQGGAEVAVDIGERALHPLLGANESQCVETGLGAMKTDPDGCSRRTEVHYASAPRVFAADSVDDDVELSLELSAGRGGRSALCRVKSLFAEVRDEDVRNACAPRYYGARETEHSGTDHAHTLWLRVRVLAERESVDRRCDRLGERSTWNGMLPAEYRQLSGTATLSANPPGR